MNTGIQDGYNLAWKLALVLRGQASLSLLETYSEERVANAKHLLQTTDRIFDFAASDEWFVQFLRMRVLPYVAPLALSLDSVKRFIFPLVSQIGINYRQSALSETDGFFSTKAGDRMPYFEIEGASVYETLREPKFHLLNFFDGQNQTAINAADLPDFVNFQTLPLYPSVAETFGLHRTFTVLLRPDNYIGLISAENTSEKVKDYLGRILNSEV